MDYIEVSGKTVDEALTNALVKLETTSDKVEYEVIEKGSSGFLGMFNKPAVIRVRKIAQTEDFDIMSVVSEIKNIDIDVKKEPARYEKKPRYEKPEKTERPEKTADRQERPAKAEKTQKPAKKPEIADKAEVQPQETEDLESKERRYRNAAAMPNEEIESRIRKFLGDMFKAMEMNVNININFDDPECVNIELSGENMGLLIGKRGQTLDSIQYLTSLVINKGKNKYVRIKIDTEDYRNRRKETLESLARNIAYKVKRSRRPVSLEPMNPYERRIIHSALQHDKFVSTRSEGEEPLRHIVVYLDKEKSGNSSR